MGRRMADMAWTGGTLMPGVEESSAIRAAAIGSTSRPMDGAISPRGMIGAYRRYARYYDAAFGPVLAPGRKALAQAVRHVQPSRLLEVGVGTGLLLAHYPRGARIDGIDICPEMLAAAQKRVHAFGLTNVSLAVMDAEALAYPDATFDCVTVPYVMSVTPNPDRLVAEVRRVCRKGGTILIVNHFSGSGVWRGLEVAVKGAADRIGFRSEFAFERHILAHDWEVLDVRKVNVLGLSRLVVVRNT
jgi:phosphatidylethanolamine/phosphatidyl-N-methylethanolamine N-methyltransferase